MTIPNNVGDLDADYSFSDEQLELLNSEEFTSSLQQQLTQQNEAEMQNATEQRIVEQEEAAQASQAPQGETQQPQPQPTAESTDQPLSGKTVTFNNGKTYAVEHIEYRNGVPFVKPEFNALYKENQPGAYFGQDLGELSTQVMERMSAPGVGVTDFATDAVNMVLPKSAQIPKVSKYEDGVAQATRQISSVVLPTIMLGGLGMAAGRAAQARVGWNLGNTAFMRFLGARGVEAGTSVAVGAVSSEYEGENVTGMLKKALPPQWDFIPDSMATLDTDSPDVKRQKNINEDLSLGFLIPFVGSARKFASAVGEVRQVFSKGNAFTKANQVLPAITAESPQAAKFIEAAQPKSSTTEQARKLWTEAYEAGDVKKSWDELPAENQQNTIDYFIEQGAIDEEVVDVAAYAIKQDEALDELGAYNLATNPDMNVALKGVHDLYDWNEIGLRTVDDFGIVGASLDAVRIAKNYDTVYGRLGSMVSPPAVKYGATAGTASEEITLGLTRQLKEAGEYGMEGAGWNITHADVAAQGEVLALELFDPSMGRKELQEILEPYIIRTADGAEYVAEEGYSALFRAIGNYSEDFTSMDIAKAQSYLATSLGGQVSDLAEGVRINAGSTAIDSAKERIKDNLMYLMKLQGVTRHYANKKVATKNRFQRMLASGKKPKPVVTDAEELPAVIARIEKEAEIFGNDLDYLNNYHPKVAEAFMELYELTDGRINSIQRLNDDIRLSLAEFRPLYDDNPEAPNIIMQAVRANWFNSMLSSIGTGAKALYGNLGGTIAEPINYFTGALLRSDMDSMKRGWMAYSALWDTQRKALPYAGQVFMKASQNPTAVMDSTRLDLVLKQEEKLAAFKKIAEDQAEQGNYGMQYLITQYEIMNDMARDPVFRLIPNSFTALDGWTNATLANAHARFRAMSELDRLGEEITPGRLKELADVEYNNMFDSNGILIDKAVKYNSSEITLNLDTNMAKSFNSLLESWPGARMFLTFPTTMANVIKQGDDYMPLPFKSFQNDINDLAFTSVEDFANNPELVDSILRRKGFNVEQMDEVARLDTLVDLKNKTLGKRAIGTFITSTIVTGLLFGKLEITGDGLYDRSAQRSREQNSDWERRTIKLGGVRINYDTILGPGLANWVAAVVNAADNFDMVGETYTEQTFEKLAFILGGSLTEGTLVSSLRPLIELLSGNSFQANRWAAGQLNSLSPLGGLRNEMGRIIDGGLKIVEDDFKAQVENRNQFLGAIDPVNRLPDLYSPVTGKIPNKYTLAQRLWNAYSFIKIFPEQSPEEKFLQDIEFDVATTFKTREGVKLLPNERSELFRLMGEQGVFKAHINRMMTSATGRTAVEQLKAARRAGISSEQLPLDKYKKMRYQLYQGLSEAEKSAFAALDPDMRTAIEVRRLAGEYRDLEAEAGIIPFTQTRK